MLRNCIVGVGGKAMRIHKERETLRTGWPFKKIRKMDRGIAKWRAPRLENEFAPEQKNIVYCANHSSGATMKTWSPTSFRLCLVQASEQYDVHLGVVQVATLSCLRLWLSTLKTVRHESSELFLALLLWLELQVIA